MLDRGRKTPLSDRAASFDDPSFKDLRVRATILGYVVGEGHCNETIFQLALRFSGGAGDDSVERAARDLVAAGLLSIEKGGVVPGPVLADHHLT